MTGADMNLSDNIDFTKTQLGVLFVMVILTVDSLNPMKIIMHVFPSIATWHVIAVCATLATYIWISEFKRLMYFAVKTFFQSVISIFLRDVEIIGRDRLPRRGPVIFTVNHANQFIDAAMLLCTTERRVNFLMAEASWRRRIIGDLAWALDVVPVKRAMDSTVPGEGTVTFNLENFENTNEIVATGIDTKFTQQLKKGDKLRPKGTSEAVKVKEVKGDDEVVLDGVGLPESELPVYKKAEPNAYDVLPRIDQKVVYEKVLDRLASGGTVGIFPEGGSHDRTDLLPLKVGVALIAYSALEQDGVNVPIVPVGLNYFRTHRWRGRAVVEYGQPTYIDPSTLEAYKEGGAEKRRVCTDLMDRIADSMRSVIVSTPDYDSLQLIHTARRLYQRKGLQVEEKQDMARRFAEGYKRLMTMTKGDPPESWLDLQRRMVDYQQDLTDLGIRDYQVPAMDREKADIDHYEGDEILNEIRLPYMIGHLALVLTLAAIPSLFINLPVGILAGVYSESRRKKALANSKVKIRGFDVMMTEKLIFCIVTIPSLWFFYLLCFYFFTDFDGPTITLLMMTFPVFSYVGIIVSEAGMVDIKDLRPFYMRLFRSTRRRMQALPKKRRELQKDLRSFIKSVGPAMGEIYYGKDLNWAQIQEKSRKSSFLEDDAPGGEEEAAKEAEEPKKDK